MKHTVRAFVAVEIGSGVRNRTQQLIERLRATAADVKWVDPHNLHLTLKFLGEVPSKEIARVCEAAKRGAAEVEPFELVVCGVGAFPNARRPRTVWVGAGSGEAAMIALHKQIETPLAKLGYRKEHRRFHPHLTIGRVRGGGLGVAELGQRIEQNADFEAGRIQVAQVIVFSSQLDRSGPTYEALGRAKLGKE
ncbi:MAG: RNA 2',3'-cyclic phosphodiesterase [Pirellulales bacterium]|nr:RNA 2',3'-cyclic phosphodiesterase [Pirellulales bacterium]